MEYFEPFLEWVWARHHNILSWYVRPLFIIPFCYFAARRSWRGLAITLLLFPTSLFWFPAPAVPEPDVLRYLAWERDFLTGDHLPAQLAFASLVLLFLAGLAAAFWKRNWWYGLAVLNVGTLMKVVWSVAFGGEHGWAALAPSIVTLVICNAAFIVAARWFRHVNTTRRKPF